MLNPSRLLEDRSWSGSRSIHAPSWPWRPSRVLALAAPFRRRPKEQDRASAVGRDALKQRNRAMAAAWLARGPLGQGGQAALHEDTGWTPPLPRGPDPRTPGSAPGGTDGLSRPTSLMAEGRQRSAGLPTVRVPVGLDVMVPAGHRLRPHDGCGFEQIPAKPAQLRDQGKQRLPERISQANCKLRYSFTRQALSRYGSLRAGPDVDPTGSGPRESPSVMARPSGRDTLSKRFGSPHRLGSLVGRVVGA
jgi:hypothetical protein